MTLRLSCTEDNSPAITGDIETLTKMARNHARECRELVRIAKVYEHSNLDELSENMKQAVALYTQLVSLKWSK